MIYHALKHDHNYVILDKTCIEDARLSWRAKGIHTYLIGKPPGWQVMRDDILKRGTEGRDAVQSALQELKAFGYADLIMVTGQGGKTYGKRWVVAETPEILNNQLSSVNGDAMTDELKTRSTVENRRTEKPFVSESVHIVRNDCLVRNERDISPTEEAEPELFGEGLAIKLPTKSEPGKVNAAVKEAKTSETLYRHRETAEAIYAEYPKKCNKLAAVKEIVKAMKSYDSAFLMEKVKSYAICRLGKDPTYTANPDNFFRQGKFLDDENLWTETPRTLAMKAGQQQSAVRQPELSASERRLARTKQQQAA